MAGGRARATACCVLAAAALTLVSIGCGTSSHANDPRPSPPTRVSVTLTNHGVVVQPKRIAFGPERNQQIPQNQNHAQPRIRSKKPLVVIFVIANQTSRKSFLEIHGRARDVNSQAVLPRSPETFQTELPTSSYFITADGIPTTNEPVLEVGPYRASSQNDVLLP